LIKTTGGIWTSRFDLREILEILAENSKGREFLHSKKSLHMKAFDEGAWKEMMEGFKACSSEL
jgi:hypothetical protein